MKQKPGGSVQSSMIGTSDAMNNVDSCATSVAGSGAASPDDETPEHEEQSPNNDELDEANALEHIMNEMILKKFKALANPSLFVNKHSSPVEDMENDFK